MNTHTYRTLLSRLGIALLFCSCSVIASQPAPSGLNRSLDAGEGWTFEMPADASAFLVIQNDGIDTTAAVLDADNNVIRRAATWRGREGRYILDLSGNDESGMLHIEVRSIEEFVARGSVGVTRIVVSAADQEHADVTAGLRSLARAADYHLAHFYGGTDQRELAMQAYQDALSRLSGTAYADWEGDIHYELGELYAELGLLSNASDSHNQAISMFQLHSDSKGLAASYNALGLINKRLGSIDTAIDYYQSSLALRSIEEDAFFVARAHNNIGVAEWESDNYAAASQSLETALSLFASKQVRPLEQVLNLSAKQISARGDLVEVANTLNNLALVKSSSGDISSAELLLRSAIELHADIKQPKRIAQVEFNLGQVLQEQGRLDEALEHLDIAADTFESLHDDYWYGQALEWIGNVYAAIDEHDDAIAHYNQALQLSGENQQQRANVLNRLANSNWQIGNTSQADAQFANAYVSFVNSNQPASAAVVASKHAQLMHQLGRTEQALESQRLAIQTLHQLGQVREAARAQSRYGQLLLNEGEQASAEQQLEEALYGHRTVNDELYELDTLTSLSRAHNGQAALDAARAATELANSIRLRTLSPDLQSNFLASRRGAFEQYINLLVDAGQSEQAWAISEQVRARSLLDLIQADGADSDAANAIRRQRDRMLAQLADVSRTQDSNKLIELRREIDLLGGQLRHNQNLVADMSAPLSATEIQVRLSDDVTMLSYFVGDQRSHLWTIDSATVRHYELASAARIGSVATELTQTLRSHRQSPSRITYIANQLSQLVLQPAADDIKNRELVVIADGSLQLVPFGLLPLDADGSNTLLDSTTVTYSPSAKVFNLLDAESFAPAANIVVLADPLATDATPLLTADDDLLALPEIQFANLMAQRSLSQSGVNISALPGARLEAAAIEEAVSASTNPRYGSNVRVMTGANASHDFVANGGLREYGVVHFATHGIVDADLPELSGLILARNQDDDSMSYLRPHEIATLDLNADLVVLSGCETGIGKSVGSEGLLSLSRPFLIAGARQVISSLWQVSDRATAQLMDRFYFHLLQENKSPEMALRLSQQWLREQPQWEHPYFWAGFVLQGGRSVTAPIAQLAGLTEKPSPPPTLVSAAL